MNKVHSILVVGIILVFSLQQGCSPAKISRPNAAGRQDDLPKGLGKIAVASAQYFPRVELQTPAKGPLKGAGRGAVQMMDELAVAANNTAPAFLVVSIVLAPFMAIAGGINGAISADSAGSVNEKEAVLRQALAEMKIQETMRDRFFRKIVEIPGRHFELSEGMGPSSDQDRPDYLALKNNGIDAVYELAVRELGLESESDAQINPSLSFYMVLQTRLINVAENKTISTQPFICRSRTRDFAYWTSNEAVQFQNEMNQCYEELAYSMTRAF